MKQQSINTKDLNKYCVVYGKEFGPHLTEHCTSNSLVAVMHVGTLKIRTLFYSFDGDQLNEDDIKRIKEHETQRYNLLKEEAKETKKKPLEYGFAIIDDFIFSSIKDRFSLLSESKRNQTGKVLAWIVLWESTQSHVPYDLIQLEIHKIILPATPELIDRSFGFIALEHLPSLDDMLYVTIMAYKYMDANNIPHTTSDQITYKRWHNPITKQLFGLIMVTKG